MTWLAFSRVPPVPALAPAGSAQSLGKVNANTGWLAHMNHSIYIFVLLPFTLLPSSSGSSQFLVSQSISHLHSHLMGVTSNNTVSPASHLRESRGRKSPIGACFDLNLAEGHFSRARVC